MRLPFEILVCPVPRDPFHDMIWFRTGSRPGIEKSDRARSFLSVAEGVVRMNGPARECPNLVRFEPGLGEGQARGAARSLVYLLRERFARGKLVVD